ncbi:2TM domain-containing protein [Sinomicrobium kalidii]|uniref:2TM domain-containing protein n=1 Tax=Sinomicrobium kalidii TaxID=2900738 RepID=UPI001E5E2065|nr:2TM domain-containing protein [Sinomicrobium kalidii]UGU15596.1 2TM domain-containing protein [Sinomicrobium kalidii]
MKTYTREERYLFAKKKLNRIKAFYRHLFWYLAINVFLLVLIGTEMEWKGDEFWSFGTFSTAIFWGIGVVIHGVTTFVPDLFLGKTWEERQIRKYMEKDKRERWE